MVRHQKNITSEKTYGVTSFIVIHTVEIPKLIDIGILEM